MPPLGDRSCLSNKVTTMFERVALIEYTAIAKLVIGATSQATRRGLNFKVAIQVNIQNEN